MAEPLRFQPAQTAHRWAVMDRLDLGRPVVRCGLDRCHAEQVASALNELDEDARFLRAILCGHGIEVRPTRRAS
jgi:hypothetical protein